MEIPLYIFLILYCIGLGLFLLWTFFNLYHVVKFGMFDFTGKMNTAVFVCYTLIVISVTVLLLQEIPWFDTVNILDFFSFSSNSKFDI